VDQRSRALGLRLALFTVTLAAYALTLGAPFQFDDRGVILRETAVHSLGWASLHGLRPLLKSSYALCWVVGGGAPLPFHVFNLLVHLLNVELVLRLYTAVTQRSSRWPYPTSLGPGVAIAGALFALHPIQTEAVAYVSGRSASLATSFQLLALLLYSEGVRSARPRFWLGYTSLAFGAALASKETSVVLPLGLLLWDYCIERSRIRAALGRFLPWLGIGLVASVVLISNERYFALLYDALGYRSLVDGLRFQLLGVSYLAQRLSLLKPLCIDPGLFLSQPGWGEVRATAAVLLLLLGLATWRARRGSRLELFGWGWCLLQVFLPFVILPRVDVINERHAYAASAALFLLVGTWCSQALEGRGRWWPLGPVAVAVVLATLTWHRTLDYRSEIALWRDTVQSAPSNPRAHNNLGVAYELAGRLPEARIAYARALKLEPRYAAARDNLLRSSRPAAAVGP